MAVLEKKEKKEEEKPIRTGFEPLSPLLASTPFAFMRHFFDDFERFFERGLLGQPLRYAPIGGWGVWAPPLDVFEKKGLLVIRIDLPGLSKEDVKVDVTEAAVDVAGERKEEKKEEREGYYRSERSYGSFHRRIPLPEGAKVEEAQATFKNGVLEVTVPLPKHAEPKARKVEIKA